MVTGVLIAQDETVPLEERSFDGLNSYQAADGGWVEAIHIETPSTTLFVNEEGKVRGLRRNPRATALWWLLSPSARGLDVIVGDAVLIGSSRGRGTTSDLPSTVRALLLETTKYQIEIAGNGGRWQRDSREFGSYFEAAVYAIVLLDQLTAPGLIAARVRVVAA